MTVLTRDVRDRAVAALRKAKKDGERLLTNSVAAELPDGTIIGCSCYIVAREFGIGLETEGLLGDWEGGGAPDAVKYWDGSWRSGAEIYDGLDALGFRYVSIFAANDARKDFGQVADVVATFPVVD